MKDDQNGKLYIAVMNVVHKVSFTEICGWAHTRLGSQNPVQCPRLQDLVWALKAELIDADDVNELQNILVSCMYPGFNRYNTENELKTCFAGEINSVEFKIWASDGSSENMHPGFIGHKDFKFPDLQQRPSVSPLFWISAVVMAAGIAAIVLAFALLQAATLAVAGVATAVVGATVLLSGIGLYRAEHRKIAAQKEEQKKSMNDAQELRDWHPIL